MKHLYHSKNILIFLVLMLVGVLLDTFLFETVAASIPAGGFAMATFMNLDKTSTCNMAGISTIAYVIDVNDVESMPTLIDTGLPEDLVTYKTDFVLKANKFWTTLYSTKEMSELLGEIDGPTDGSFFRIKASLFHPSTQARALGLTVLFKDADVIVILKEVSTGKQLRVVGDKDVPASMKGSENSGKAYSDEKGITFAIEAANCTLAKVYTGAIILEADVLYTPERMDIDATTVDYNTSERWVVGANTGAIVLTDVENLLPGQTVRIEFDGASTGTLAFNASFGAAALIDTDGEWFQITKADDNSLVITDGNFV